ncbi:unnamed protein product, partial [Polarella glacialis]
PYVRKAGQASVSTLVARFLFLRGRYGGTFKHAGSRPVSSIVCTTTPTTTTPTTLFGTSSCSPRTVPQRTGSVAPSPSPAAPSAKARHQQTDTSSLAYMSQKTKIDCMRYSSWKVAGC